MDLSKEQLDWLAAHFVHPGKAWIKPPPLEQSLLDLGLIKSEVFPYEDGFDVFVLSLTKRGWAAAVLHRADDVRKYYGMFDLQFIKLAEMSEMTLDQLPEFLSSDNDLTRLIASKRLDALFEDKGDG